MSSLVQAPGAEALERVIMGGDLGQLSVEERLQYYRAVCESVGLNPLTQPFEYLKLNGRLVLYARKGATDQLRRIYGVSIDRVEQSISADVVTVTAYARDASGRQDSDMGVVPIKGLSGDALANAIMRAITKAKRRVTLSLCGLGMLDESELETIPARSIERPALDAPTEPPAAPTGSLVELGRLLKSAGFTGKRDGPEFVAWLLGLDGLDSVRSLTAEQVQLAIDTLTGSPDAVEQWLQATGRVGRQNETA